MYSTIVKGPSVRRTRSTPFYSGDHDRGNAARTRNVRIWVRGGSPKGSAPYPEDDTLAGWAVVVGGDAPAAVAPDHHPGRAHQALARDSVLPGEEDPGQHRRVIVGPALPDTGRPQRRRGDRPGIPG